MPEILYLKRTKLYVSNIFLLFIESVVKIGMLERDILHRTDCGSAEGLVIVP